MAGMSDEGGKRAQPREDSDRADRCASLIGRRAEPALPQRRPVGELVSSEWRRVTRFFMIR